MKKSWAYLTTWELEEVPIYWQSIWGLHAFNNHKLKRQWTKLDAAKFLRVKNENDVSGSFSIII